MKFQFIFYLFTISSSVALSWTSLTMLDVHAAPTPVNTTAQAGTEQRILFVDPQQGTDTASAGTSQASPFRTITYALSLATPGTTIQLASGQYTAETFPLALKPGVTLRGNEAEQGQDVAIAGGNFYVSPSFARQNVTILAAENTQIIGITVTNPNRRGTAIWVESGNPVIRNNTFINNKREGIFVTGNAAPRIENNQFVNNDANGISVTKNAQGEIRGNIFDNTGFGIAIGGNSTPLVANNQIKNNRSGVILTDAARPNLMSNVIENNREYGLVIMGNASPDLSDNTFRGNKRNDQLNITASQPTPPTPNGN